MRSSTEWPSNSYAVEDTRLAAGRSAFQQSAISERTPVALLLPAGAGDAAAGAVVARICAARRWRSASGVCDSAVPPPPVLPLCGRAPTALGASTAVPVDDADFWLLPPE